MQQIINGNVQIYGCNTEKCGAPSCEKSCCEQILQPLIVPLVFSVQS